jgi:exodeoxyribonuclease I
LYGGFVPDTDRRLLNRVRAMTPDQLAEFRPMFQDERLEELTFRYRARNFPQTLSEEDQERWAMVCIDKLVDGAFGARTLEAFLASLDTLEAAHTDERARGILASLRSYAMAIAP